MKCEPRWMLVIGLAALSLAAGLLPGAFEALRWQREAIDGGQWARLLSGHLVHLDARHLLLNLLGLVLVAEWLLEEWRPVGLLSLLLSSALGTGLLLWLLEPELHWYAGLSGALHGLWAGAALAGWLRWRRLLFVAAMAALGLRLALLNDGAGGMPVVGIAHVYGAASGLAWALASKLLRPARDHFD